MGITILEVLSDAFKVLSCFDVLHPAAKNAFRAGASRLSSAKVRQMTQNSKL